MILNNLIEQPMLSPNNYYSKYALLLLLGILFSYLLNLMYHALNNLQIKSYSDKVQFNTTYVKTNDLVEYSICHATTIIIIALICKI